MKYSKIKATIDDKNIVFVDCFDTVIFRSVHPLEVIKIWSKQIKSYFLISCDFMTVYKTRMESMRYLSAFYDSPSYDQLMCEMFLRLNNSNFISSNVNLKRFYSLALEIEILLEKKVQIVNRNVVEILGYAKHQGKKVYCISDFYLSKTEILQFLKFLKIEHLFDGIFISSDYHQSKQNGTLYQTILTELAVQPNQSLMLGDNYKSDFQNASKKGIQSIHIKNKYNNIFYKFYHQFFEEKSAKKQFFQKYKKIESECRHSDYCFSEYILIYYFFSEKLFQALVERNIADVIFLAREGWILKQFFEIYQNENVPEEQRIRTHYFKMSRQSAVIVMQNELGKESFSHAKKISIENFLISTGFSSEQIQYLQKHFSMNFSTVIVDFTNSVEFQELQANEIFKDFYAKNTAENKEAFKKYYNSLSIPHESIIGIVDIGWRGAMQDCLHQITNQRTAGFYLGLKNTLTYIEEGHTKNGLIFTSRPCYSLWYNLLDVNNQIYEQILMAPHGSAVSYSTNNGEKGYVVNENYRLEESFVYKSTVKPVQDYMINIFRKVCNNHGLQLYHDHWMLHCIALTTIKSGLFVNRKRRSFLQELSNGFVNNFANAEIGLKYNPQFLFDFKKIQSFLRHPTTILKYATEAYTIKNPIIREIIFLVFILPYYFLLRLILQKENQ